MNEITNDDNDGEGDACDYDDGIGIIEFNKKLPVLIKMVDVSYGGENGFNQAIELSGEALRNVKFVQEKKLIYTDIQQLHFVQ